MIRTVKMSRYAGKLVRIGVWSRAKQLKHPETLKVGTPFDDYRRFKFEYETDEPKIDELLKNEYLRRWQRQRDRYLENIRHKEQDPKKKYPIYRKPVVRPAEKTELPRKRSKKYAHVKPKVNTYLNQPKMNEPDENSGAVNESSQTENEVNDTVNLNKAQ